MKLVTRDTRKSNGQLCEYHWDYGHVIIDCWALAKEIEELNVVKNVAP